MYMIEKDVISQLVEEKLASSGNYLVDVVIKPGNLIIIEIDNDEVPAEINPVGGFDGSQLGDAPVFVSTIALS